MKKATKKPAKPATKKPQHRGAKAKPTQREVKRPMENEENVEQQAAKASGELAKELTQTKQTEIISKTLDEMNAHELRDLAWALVVECKRLSSVEARYDSLMADLEDQAEAEGDGLQNERRAVNSLRTSQWTRGKLPGGKLIKTDNVTGKFEEIDQAEWDRLPAN